MIFYILLALVIVWATPGIAGAQADLVCYPYIQSNDPNPIIKTLITETVTGSGRVLLHVTHVLSDGSLRTRGTQYEYTNVSFVSRGKSGYDLVWSGRLKTDKRTRIVGISKHAESSVPTYTESWFTLRPGKPVPSADDMRGYKFERSETSRCAYARPVQNTDDAE